MLYSNNGNSNGFKVNDLDDQPNIQEEVHKISEVQEDNPAINNIFSDDGIVVRHHHHHHNSDQTKLPTITKTRIPSKDQENTTIRSESPTYGMTYFSALSTNIVWPKEVYAYNKLVFETLEKIKRDMMLR